MPATDDDFDESARQGVIEHMNADHADALVLYAEVFGGITRPRSAVMTDIDTRGMRLEVEDGATAHAVRVEFDQPLASRGAARAVLVDMVRRARETLADRQPSHSPGNTEE